MTSSDYIASAALIVALLVMIATFWQAHVARSYGRISVRPHLDWGTCRYPGRPVSLYLLNSGLGPAVVNSVSLFFDGKEYGIEGLQLPEEIEREIKSLHGYSEWNLFNKDTPIASGARISLIEIDSQPFTPERHNRAVELIDRVGLVIDYSSMYKERFHLERRPART